MAELALLARDNGHGRYPMSRGLGRVSTSGNGLALASTLTKAVSLGAATYVVTLLAAWLNSGRPESA